MAQIPPTPSILVPATAVTVLELLTNSEFHQQPVPGPTLNGFRPLLWEGLMRDRAAVRQDAERRFDPAVTAEQFHRVLEGWRKWPSTANRNV